MDLNNLCLVEKVANRLNATEGTDYRAVLVEEQRNIADAVLTSESRQWPTRLVQITTVPQDIQHREVTDNRERLERDLAEAVSSRETDCVVSLGLTDDGNRFGLKRKEVQRLAELIARSAGQADAAWSGEQLWEVDPELSEYVSWLSIQRLPGYGKVNVIIPLTRHAPLDPKWIEDGIELKLKKYARGRPEAVQNVTLVIGALGLVLPDQVDAFRDAHKPEDLPFEEIWIVSPFDGATCVKPRRR